MTSSYAASRNANAQCTAHLHLMAKKHIFDKCLMVKEIVVLGK